MADVDKILKEMTLEEKASLASGKTFWLTKPIPRLGVPSVLMTDGPHGLRKEVGAERDEKGRTNVMKSSEKSTCFPPAVTSASTWDPDLLYRMGQAIGEEAQAQHVSTVLGPGINMKRNPLCGRNFEYFSEDPLLASRLATSFVQGVQSQDVGCSLKHFCGNNQEYNRMSVDTIVDERTLREIYLPAFERTVKDAQPYQVMCSYNKLNGTYLSDNRRMLTDVLRKEWHFDGIVVSDWGATNDRVEGVKAGMDLQMPTCKGIDDRAVVRAVRNGDLDEADLDAMTARLLRYAFRCADGQTGAATDYTKHHALCREIGAKGAVLLKNEGLLPLRDDETVAVIGKLAEESRYQGAGSSRIECKNLVHLTTALRQEGKKYTYAQGYTLQGDGVDENLLQEAVRTARGKDKVVLVVGLTDAYESEGFDRTHLDLPEGHNKLVEAVLAVNKNVVIVLEGGSPMRMPWKDKVGAILNVYLQGEAVGESICDLLYGKVCPCGKLAETFPEELSDVLSQKYFPMGPKTVEYREGIFIGYRYFDSARKNVAFPFGFGLSYTSFVLSDFAVTDDFTVTCTVENVGKVAGSEVVQAYVHAVDSPVFRAEKELKGFTRVSLEPSEKKTVTVKLDERAYAFYNTAVNDWSVLSGKYEILVGTSSRDILFTEERTVVGQEEVALPAYSEEVKQVYGRIDACTEIPASAFASLYGKELPDNSPYKVGNFHQNCTLSDVSCTKVGKGIVKVMKFIGKLIAGDSVNAAMIVNTVTSLPLRAFSGFSGGALSPYSVAGLVDIFNKKKGGFRKFLAGFLPKNK